MTYSRSSMRFSAPFVLLATASCSVAEPSNGDKGVSDDSSPTELLNNQPAKSSFRSDSPMIGNWSMIGKASASAPANIEIDENMLKLRYLGGSIHALRINNLTITKNNFLQITTDPPYVIYFQLSDEKLCKITSLGSKVEACYKKALKS